MLNVMSDLNLQEACFKILQVSLCIHFYEMIFFKSVLNIFNAKFERNTRITNAGTIRTIQ